MVMKKKWVTCAKCGTTDATRRLGSGPHHTGVHHIGTARIMICEACSGTGQKGPARLCRTCCPSQHGCVPWDNAWLAPGFVTEPTAPMKTLHRWVSVPFCVHAETDAEAITNVKSILGNYLRNPQADDNYVDYNDAEIAIILDHKEPDECICLPEVPSKDCVWCGEYPKLLTSQFCHQPSCQRSLREAVAIEGKKGDPKNTNDEMQLAYLELGL